MDRLALQRWIELHAETISAFVDFMPEVCEESETNAWLRERDPSRHQQHQFLSLGFDGSHGEFTLWLNAPSTDAPVVFFGSEGGAGVIAPSAFDFVRALAHGAGVCEYDDDPAAPSRFSPEDNWMLTEPDIPKKERARARAALARYRAAVEAAYGPLPPFDTLVRVDARTQAPFRHWFLDVQQRIETKRAAAARQVIESRRAVKRERATRFAAADSVPAELIAHPDGIRYAGSCGGCRAQTRVRLTRFQELAFGLCPDCYCSNVW